MTSKKCRTCSAKFTISTCSGIPPSPVTFSPMQIRAGAGASEFCPSAPSASTTTARRWSVPILCGRSGAPRCRKASRFKLLATRRMKLWANGLDPDFPHSEHVASLSLQLYDGLLRWGWQPSVDGSLRPLQPARRRPAARCRQVQGEKGHHKTSFDMIRAHGNPLGWKPADLQRAAIVARFHRGALPTRSAQDLARSSPRRAESDHPASRDPAPGQCFGRRTRRPDAAHCVLKKMAPTTTGESRRRRYCCR